MEKEKLEGLLIDYIDGRLDPADKAFIEKEIAAHEEIRMLYWQLKDVILSLDNSTAIEPSANLKAAFDQYLELEIRNNGKKSIFLHLTFFRVAAAVALLMMGGGIGFWINAYQRQQAALEAMRKEVEATKVMMITMLRNHQSASQRLQGANVAYQMESPDDEIVKALVKAMNEDPSTNVRLAALDALSRFHQQEHVRKALVASLVKQNDPAVQIALIRLMVDMKEKEVMGELQRITNDEEALPAVKDEAHVGLLRLS